VKVFIWERVEQVSSSWHSGGDWLYSPQPRKEQGQLPTLPTMLRSQNLTRLMRLGSHPAKRQYSHSPTLDVANSH
jgi:hypothetical protein